MAGTRWCAAAALAGWAAVAAGQPRGGGVGWTGGPPPATKSAGPDAERAASTQARPPDFSLGLGFLGARGAAQDVRGALRLEGYGRLRAPAVAPSYGEAAPGAAASPYASWSAGDRVRSTSAADVRAARGQQAPDLEWAGAQAAAGRASQPYGIQFQRAQERAEHAGR